MLIQNCLSLVGLRSVYDHHYLAAIRIKNSLVLSYDKILVIPDQFQSDTRVFQCQTMADIYLHKYVFPAHCRVVLGYLG